MLPVGFEPAIPAADPRVYLVVTGAGCRNTYRNFNI